MKPSDAYRRLRSRPQHVRLFDRQFTFHGLERNFFGDFYHNAMRVSWPVFFAGFAVAFVSMNTVFSLIYWLGDQPIANTRPGSLTDLFFFSIETLATVGYGDMHPQTTYGHLVATVEIFTGLSTLAVMTGLVFSRFSRPKARVLFAAAPVIALHDGKLTLMVRMANARHNLVSEARAKLWLTRLETTAEGKNFRRFHLLQLQREENPLFALSWTLFHVIDEWSLLADCGPEDLDRVKAQFVVTFSGLDEQSAQNVSARHTYEHSDLRWHHNYVDIITVHPDGHSVVDYSLLHDTVPYRPEAAARPESAGPRGLDAVA